MRFGALVRPARAETSDPMQDYDGTAQVRGRCRRETSQRPIVSLGRPRPRHVRSHFHMGKGAPLRWSGSRDWGIRVHKPGHYVATRAAS